MQSTALALAGVDTFKDTITHIEALTLLASLPSQSIDAIVTDFPYNTTACEWDSMIDLKAFWKGAKRVLKPGGVLTSTASQPFTTILINSNFSWFRYEWIWEKTLATGYLNANRVPLKAHENVIVFYGRLMNYYPVMEQGKAYRATSGAVGGHVRDKTVGGYVTINDGARYPRSVLKFPSAAGYHPTQKPVELFEYLIRTYTRPGAIVLDPFSGSGTTALAARNTGRHYICGDTSEEYVTIARQRLATPYTPDMFTALPQPPAPKPEQHALFATP